jgi:hypothetical protein
LLDNDAECPGCGYDLFGLESATCPECGTRLTITALKRGRMRWLTPSFVFGLIGLVLALGASLWLPVKAYWWMAREYRETPRLLVVEGLALLPAFGVVVAGMKWVNYSMAVARLPRLERWGLALGCWVVLGVMVLVVWGA